MTIIWFKKPNFNTMALALIALILFQLAFFGTRWDNQNQKEWIVFNVKKNTLIAERNGESITAYCNDSIQKKLSENMTFKSYLVANFSNIENRKKIQNTAYFNNKSILILDSLGVYPKHIKSDILVITQSPKLNLERLFKTFKPKMVVADASNYKTYVACWKATCLKEKIPFHATGEKGFFRLN